MSGLRIKTKIMPNYWNPEKDLQSTAYSSKAIGCYSTIHNQQSIPIINSHIIPNSTTKIQSTQKHQQPNTISQINSKKQIKWSYNSPIQSKKNIDHSATYNYSQQKTACSSQNNNKNININLNLNTPLSKSQYNKDKNLEKRIINDFNQVNTVQTKYMLNTTPNQVLEQSQIIFKGSRDVNNIIPIKLVYQEMLKDQGNEDQMLLDTNQNQYKSTSAQQLQVKLIKKSNNQASLILIQNSMHICSLIKLRNSFCLNYFIDQNILPIYYKHKLPNKTYLFCQPYQYTLDQLYRYKKITSQNIQIICKNIQNAIRALCNIKYSFFQIEGIQKCIFYCHGKFKILPIFTKGKIVTARNYDKVMKEIESYLYCLLRNNN